MPTALHQALDGLTSRDRILAVATELFGRHGFAAVTTRQIAAAADLNVATVAHHVGGKAALYAAVLERAAATEAALVDDALDSGGDDLRGLLHDLLDRYLQLLQDEPALAGLWTRRRLEREDHDALEHRLVRPPLERLTRRLEEAARDGEAVAVDAELLVRTVLWTSYGHFTSGTPDVARLRRYLHDLLDRVLLP